MNDPRTVKVVISTSSISPVKVIEIPAGMMTVHRPDGTTPPTQVAESVNEPDILAVKVNEVDAIE